MINFYKDFAVLTPPPNLTGKLHYGHIMNYTINFFIQRRFKKFFGADVGILYGFDAAYLYSEIIAKGDLKLMKSNAQASEDAIKNKIADFGFCFDNADSPIYTSGDVAESVVKDVYRFMRENGYMYKGGMVVYYDSSIKTVMSDIEIAQREGVVDLYYVKYRGIGCESVVVATTRPETIVADLCLVVSQEESREIEGKTFENPITGGHMLVYKHSSVAADFGTGIMKVTPAFSSKDDKIFKDLGLVEPTDYYEKHSFDIKRGSFKSGEFAGMSLTAARKACVELLSSKGLLIKVEEHSTIVKISSRTKEDVCEVYSEQYFIDLAKIVKDSGIDFRSANVIGSCGLNTINHFEKSLRPWCVSRQNNFGIRIDDGNVYDTWAVSCLFPIIANKTIGKDLSFMIVSAHDITFFWLYRMLYMCNAYLGRNIICRYIIHGIICDKKGEKISKSKNNEGELSINVESQIEAETISFGILLHRLFEKKVVIDETRFVRAKRIMHKLANIIKYLSINKVGVCDECPDVLLVYFCCKMRDLVCVDDEVAAINNIPNIVAVFEEAINTLTAEKAKGKIAFGVLVDYFTILVGCAAPSFVEGLEREFNECQIISIVNGMCLGAEEMKAIEKALRGKIKLNFSSNADVFNSIYGVDFSDDLADKFEITDMGEYTIYKNK